MSVKIKDTMSIPRTVPGGSPQGSILGNFLFCTTTDCFTSLTGEPSMEQLSSSSESETSESDVHVSPVREPPLFVSSTPSTRGQFAQFKPPESLANLSGAYKSEEESFDFFRVKRRYDFDTLSSSEPDSIYEQIEGATGKLHSIKSYVYIDDFNAIESVNLKSALSFEVH